MGEENKIHKKLSEVISGARAPRLYHIKKKKAMGEENKNHKKHIVSTLRRSSAGALFVITSPSPEKNKKIFLTFKFV